MIALTTRQGESHEPRNPTSHHSDPDAGGGYANLAAQQELGLRTQWRLGSGGGHHHCAAVDGASVTGHLARRAG